MIYGLAERLRELRTQKSLTQVQVAERIGVTKNAVNAWETQTSSPSLKHVVRLAQVLGVSADYLLGVNEKLTLDISDFNDLQKEAIWSLAHTFNKMNQK